jgi:hypothetical protein
MTLALAPRRLALAAALALVGALAAMASAEPAATACGSATLATVEAVDSTVTNSVYGGELEGGEAIADARHVTSSTALASAVARGDDAAVLAVVKAIVYHPAWHVVRLTVLDTAGAVVATYGGRYVLAPVSGTLERHGQTVGSFLMSVQDDIGFAKLETRFVGDPIALYLGGVNVAQLGGSLPSAPPPGPLLGYRGTSYGVVTENYRAIPLAPLAAVILVAPPSAALAAQPCPSVRTEETARIVARIAARYPHLSATLTAFAETASSYTGATVVVAAGKRTVTGGPGPAPARLPASGPLSAGAHEWWVASFAPARHTRVYVLVTVAAS